MAGYWLILSSFNILQIMEKYLEWIKIGVAFLLVVALFGIASTVIDIMERRNAPVIEIREIKKEPTLGEPAAKAPLPTENSGQCEQWAVREIRGMKLKVCEKWN